MPYVVDPEAILTATMRGKHEAQDVMTILHYRYNGSQQIADGAAALDAFWQNFSGVNKPFNAWVACLSNKVTNIKVQLQWITPVRFAFRTYTNEFATSGNVEGAAMPVNTSVAITKRTPNAGRRYVGTIHMPGVPAEYIVDGQLTNDAKNNYDTFALRARDAISTAIPAAEFLPVLFHKSSPSISPQVTSTEVQTFARVMRRRTVGVGS